MPNKLVQAIADMREEDALARAHELLDGGVEPIVVLDGCREAMKIVGQRFENGQYFIPELILAGEMVAHISDLAQARMTAEPGAKVNRIGKVVIGTVAGDIHDIGKNIVVFMLDVNGFEVYDLGVDVSPQAFVSKIVEVKPDVVGLSGFLTLAFDAMKETVEAIKAAGLRDSVKIMIGGGAVDEQVKAYTGADAYGPDAMSAVSLAREWVGG
jgi:5-methyltetrahydrofolate--homocysteine methyltransferase